MSRRNSVGHNRRGVFRGLANKASGSGGSGPPPPVVVGILDHNNQPILDHNNQPITDHNNA